MTTIKGKIFIAGCGAVAQCFLHLLFKNFSFNPRNIKIVDPVDKRDHIKEFLQQGVVFEQIAVTHENFVTLLGGSLQQGDIFIDIANQVDTYEILQWCFLHDIHYINTSLNNWPTNADPSIYALRKSIQRLLAQTTKNTAILSHGADPGLVSSFVKQALIDSAKHTLKTKKTKALEAALTTSNFPQLAHLLGVKVIHITENDTHVINRRKKENEFLSTWSVVEFAIESVARAEFAWGTHEQEMPKEAATENGSIIFKNRALDITLTSWLPHEEYSGIIPPHDEAFSIADYLSVKENGTYSYRPTVVFVYNPCDVAKESLQELKKRNFVMQTHKKVVQKEIVDGKEAMGCLLMGEFGAWWTGSIVSLPQARRCIPAQNGTILQVAAGVMSALDFLLHNPNRGIVMPEQLDHEHILRVAKPYLGEFLSMPVDYRHDDGRQFKSFISSESLIK